MRSDYNIMYLRGTQPLILISYDYKCNNRHLLKGKHEDEKDNMNVDKEKSQNKPQFVTKLCNT